MEYLAIKNWDKYQSTKKGFPWIKDYINQSDDPELARLNFFQRGLLQELRRLRARTGKNIFNDANYIGTAVCCLPEERHCIGRTIAVLVSRGLLIITNQQVSPLEEKRIDEKREEKPSQRKAPSKTDSRFKQFVEILLRYHGKFVGSALSFKVWFGKRGGRNLKQLLAAEPDLDLATFEKAVAVRARSPNVNHSQPVYEWISHVLSGPKGFQNGQSKVSNAEQKQQRNDDKYARIEQRIAGVPASIGIVVPGGIGGSGNRDVDTRPKLLPPGGSEGGG